MQETHAGNIYTNPGNVRNVHICVAGNPCRKHTPTNPGQQRTHIYSRKPMQETYTNQPGTTTYTYV